MGSIGGAPIKCLYYNAIFQHGREQSKNILKMSSGDFMRRQNRRIRIAISLSVRPPKGNFTAFV